MLLVIQPMKYNFHKTSMTHIMTYIQFLMFNSIENSHKCGLTYEASFYGVYITFLKTKN